MKELHPCLRPHCATGLVQPQGPGGGEDEGVVRCERGLRRGPSPREGSDSVPWGKNGVKTDVRAAIGRDPPNPGPPPHPFSSPRPNTQLPPRSPVHCRHDQNSPAIVDEASCHTVHAAHWQYRGRITACIFVWER